MNNNQSSERMVSSIAAALVLGVALFLGISRVDQFLKGNAVTDCAKFATYATDTTKSGAEGEQILTHSVEPIHSMYKTCMLDKGYTTELK